MGFEIKQLKEAPKTLYDFGGRKIKQIGFVSLLVSFSSLRNARTEYITFDVVEMNYPYNAIFRRDLLITFEAALHSLYLCLKVPVALEVISIHGSQKDARNIEQDFALGHRNINCLQDEKNRELHRKQANRARRQDQKSSLRPKTIGHAGSRPCDL
jgi:hypothetical protein